MAKKPEPPKFWLTYRHPDGGTAGVVVIESPSGFFMRALRLRWPGPIEG
jgi:hypothetical protein